AQGGAPAQRVDRLASAQPAAASSARLSARLATSLAGAMPTMDRRSFLKRSGIGVGAGLAASQLTLIRKADAAEGKAAGNGKGDIVVRRTVC
ncbi:twin-arginine translocation signal domain-containing protein, partial [Acinetobacter baumannii]